MTNSYDQNTGIFSSDTFVLINYDYFNNQNVSIKNKLLTEYSNKQIILISNLKNILKDFKNFNQFVFDNLANEYIDKLQLAFVSIHFSNDPIKIESFENYIENLKLLVSNTKVNNDVNNYLLKSTTDCNSKNVFRFLNKKENIYRTLKYSDHRVTRSDFKNFYYLLKDQLKKVTNKQDILNIKSQLVVTTNSYYNDQTVYNVTIKANELKPDSYYIKIGCKEFSFEDISYIATMFQLEFD